ncbi:19974_t:CDS:2, partial [Racocetra persica]
QGTFEPELYNLENNGELKKGWTVMINSKVLMNLKNGLDCDNEFEDVDEFKNRLDHDNEFKNRIECNEFEDINEFDNSSEIDEFEDWSEVIVAT